MFSLVCCLMCLTGSMEDTTSKQSVALQQLHDAAESPVVEGDDGWLFLRRELHFLGAGPFWGEHAPAVSKARKSEWADPEAAIIDFHTQLDGAGIELLLVPVPAKATVMAAHLPVESTTENDADMQTFLARLRGAGVDVLDLKPHLTTLTASGTPPYLQTDTHWSPAGLQVSADAIAAWLANKGMIPELSRSPLQSPTPRSMGHSW